MQKGLITSILIFLVTVQLATAQDTLVYESGGVLLPEQAAYNVHYYNLDLKVDPSDSTVSGTVEVHFNMVHPSNVIALALDPRLDVEKIEWIGNQPAKKLNFTHKPADKNLMVYFPETLQPGSNSAIAVTYSGKPRVAENPPWGGGMVWAETPSGEPWVGVATQTNGAWIWWPNKDHPSDKPDSTSINLMMPDHLVAASNGRSRGETDHQNGWKTWHWFVSTPINNYNITLNAAPYEIIKDTYTSTAGDEMDIIFWVLPEFLEEGRWLFPQFAEQMRFLEEILGPYPFRADKYGVAHAPYLGMEHQTLIAYGASFENDNLFGQEAGFDDLHQHELAHEWWGNMVTAWDWRDFWIHEGIGTYMQPLYAEHLGGMEAYHKMMDFLQERITSQSEVAPRRTMSSVEITGGGRGGDVYYKGAWFMHTLRYYTGDEKFFRILRRFAYPDPELEQKTDGSPVRFATTDDLLHLAEKITEMDLEWLFEIYLRQPELPKLRASRIAGMVTLQWEIPDGYRFPMPIEVRLDEEIISLVPENNRVAFEVPDDVEVEADPHNWILKEFILSDK